MSSDLDKLNFPDRSVNEQGSTPAMPIYPRMGVGTAEAHSVIEYDPVHGILVNGSPIGGGASYPGVTGDGQTPGGLVVAGGITAGDQTVGSAMQWNGTLEIDAISNINEPTLFLRQLVGFTGINGNKSTLYVQRGNSGGTSITRPVVTIENDDPASVADALYYFSPDGLHDVQINVYGGLGLFNHAAPVAPSSITGALSTVTDAAAKAVLTSIIAALTADGGATNSTT